MTGLRSIARPAGWAGMLLLLGAVGVRPAAAQERPLFEWRGRVDREIRLVMRDGSVEPQYGDVQDRMFSGQNLRVLGAVPNQPGRVLVRRQSGRGAVDVVDQPSPANGYATVISIRDDAAGADNYQVQAYWVPDGGTWAGGQDRNGGAWDRGDDRRDNGKHKGWEKGKHNGWDRGDRDRDDDRGDRDRGNDRGGWNRGDYGAPAYGSGMLRWSGDVDDYAEIRIQGRRVEAINLRGDRLRAVRSNFSGWLPARDAAVRVESVSGRGQVSVVQQPSARNGYTAVIRVRDARAGYGRYSFVVRW